MIDDTRYEVVGIELVGGTVDNTLSRVGRSAVRFNLIETC